MFFRSQQRKEWLNPKVSRHISHVHYTLSVYTFLFGLSSWLGTYINISYLNLEVVGSLGLFATLFGLNLLTLRDKFLLQVSYMIPISMGLLFSPSIYNSYKIDPTVVFITTISTSVIFLSMSVTAYYIQLVDVLYFWGFLTSCINVAIFIMFINLVIDSETLDFSNTLFLLLISILYVLFRTKIIIEESYLKELNKYEVVIEAICLFGGLSNIFIKIHSLFVNYVFNLKSVI